MVLHFCFRSRLVTAQPRLLQRSFLATTRSLLNNNRPARVVVVGSGRMGEIRSKLIYSNPKLQLAGIVDNFGLEKAQNIAHKLGTTAYSSLSEVWSAQNHDHDDDKEEGHQQSIDGIVCCTPTGTHASIIQQSLRIPSVSGIFVEKPVDESASKIQALFRMVRNNNNRSGEGQVQLCCGFQRRFDLSYQALLEQSQSIGKILGGNVFFGDHPGPPLEFLLQGGDIFMDLSAHDVDFILQVMKRQHQHQHDENDFVTSVYASGTSSAPELEAAGIHDNATMVLNFQSGAAVTIFMSRSASYGYDQRCEMFGSQGMVQVANVHETSTVLSNSDGIHTSKYQHSFPQRFAHAFELEIDAFADNLLYRTPWPVTEDDCIQVQRIADAAQESCATGQVVKL